MSSPQQTDTLQEQMAKSLFPIFLKSLKQRYFVADKETVETFINDLVGSTLETVFEIMDQMLEESFETLMKDEKASPVRKEHLQHTSVFIETAKNAAVPVLKERFAEIVARRIANYGSQLSGPTP